MNCCIHSSREQRFGFHADELIIVQDSVVGNNIYLWVHRDPCYCNTSTFSQTRFCDLTGAGTGLDWYGDGYLMSKMQASFPI